MSFRFPTFSPTHLSNVLGTRSSARAVSFLYALLSWNPSWRSSAQEALRHSYFRMPTQHQPQNQPQREPLSNNVFHDDKCEAAEIASLSLRPRNNNNNDTAQPPPQPQSQQPHGMRLPLPLTEIEPHYSRYVFTTVPTLGYRNMYNTCRTGILSLLTKVGFFLIKNGDKLTI